MWLRIGLKACLLLIVVATAHRAGWICHELAKWSNYRHGLSAGEQLRSNFPGSYGRSTNWQRCRINRSRRGGNSRSTASGSTRQMQG